MRKFALTLLGLLCTVLGRAQSKASAMAFDSNGEFRIVLLTDFSLASSTTGTEQKKFILSMVDIEHPQCVVMEGMEGSDNSLSAELRKNGIATFSLSKSSGRDEVVPILSSDRSSVVQLLYFFDSYASVRNGAKPRCGGFSFDQISWYRQQSLKYAKANGDVPLPAIAFMCQPLPEYCEASREYSYSKSIKKGVWCRLGRKGSAVTCAAENSGMFTSMLECGDVRGVFCGTDVDNDFALVWKNIMLAYGRCSSVGRQNCGVRVIVLKERSNEFDTYLRNATSETSDLCTYPNSFPILK